MFISKGSHIGTLFAQATFYYLLFLLLWTNLTVPMETSYVSLVKENKFTYMLEAYQFWPIQVRKWGARL